MEHCISEATGGVGLRKGASAAFRLFPNLQLAKECQGAGGRLLACLQLGPDENRDWTERVRVFFLVSHGHFSLWGHFARGGGLCW